MNDTVENTIVQVIDYIADELRSISLQVSLCFPFVIGLTMELTESQWHK